MQHADTRTDTRIYTCTYTYTRTHTDTQVKSPHQMATGCKDLKWVRILCSSTPTLPREGVPELSAFGASKPL